MQGSAPSYVSEVQALKELDSLTNTLVMLPGGICYHYAFEKLFGSPDSVECNHLLTSCDNKCSVCDGSFAKMLLPVKLSELTKMLKQELNGKELLLTPGLPVFLCKRLTCISL
jgi:hypothetical protein